MTGSADRPVSASAGGICALHEARARAELRRADTLAPGSDAVAWRGSLIAQVAVVKGLPGPDEASGGAAVSGADGEAVIKALVALGYAEDDVFYTLSRPQPDIDDSRTASRLRAQIEAVDPSLILALDGESAADVAAAFGIGRPQWGREAWVLGRRFIAVDGLEASLADPARKRRVWEQLKAARIPGPVY